MIRPICKDTFLLRQKSVCAAKEDICVAQDLLDTLSAHAEECVGMAANMIGIPKRIIAISIGPVNVAMLNPVITNCAVPYEAEEGCLSLTGVRKTTRYESIELHFLDLNFCEKTQVFTGFVAQIIQHEIDHCEGILI